MDNQLIKTAMHDACIRAVTEISADVKDWFRPLWTARQTIPPRACLFHAG